MDANVLRAEDLRRELPATAAYLGVDVTDAVALANLTAAAITQLAWRNGPVELWHRASPSRIPDSEMMRANAATTRVVRGHLADAAVARIADALVPVRDALTDPDRRLPGGRTVVDLAAGAEEFQVYIDQVRLFFDRCGKLVARLGPYDVVGALACYAAAACWKWWLAPGWPSIVDKTIDSLHRRPARRPADHGSRVGCPTLPSDPNLARLRERLLAGPDRLSTLEARFCRLATLNARLPQDHGLSPRSRRLLPPAHQDLIRYLESPGERFRQRLGLLYPLLPVPFGIPKAAAKHRR